MAVNWPPDPSTYPTWPPPEINSVWLSFSCRKAMEDLLGKEYGYTWRNPTTAERNLYFKNVECDENHQVTGIMVVAPDGRAWPFGYCVSASHRALMVLWPPYDAGYLSDR